MIRKVSASWKFKPVFILIYCSGYIALTLILLNVERPMKDKDDYDWSLHSQMDVVGLAVKPTCVTEKTIQALNQYFGPRRIIVISTTQQACSKFETFGKNIECLIDTDLLPGVSRKSIQNFLTRHYDGFEGGLFQGRDMSGWYLQQFLKLGAQLYVPNLSKYHLVWDLDMILLSPLKIFNTDAEAKKTIINIGGLRSTGYEYSYHNLSGQQLLKAPDGTSFVTHWSVIYSPYMKEFLGFLASRPIAEPVPEGPRWVWAVLSALHPGWIHMGFSEYASFATWLLYTHPESIYVNPRKTWNRHPVESETTKAFLRYLSPTGLCCPTDQSLATMKALGYQYVGYEIGHSVICHYNDDQYKYGYGV